jgi:hypothetical protein
MRSRTAWLVGLLLAAGAWLLVHGRGEPAGSLPAHEGSAASDNAGLRQDGAGAAPDDRAHPTQGGQVPLPSVANDAAAPGVVGVRTRSDSAVTRSPSTTGAVGRPPEPAQPGLPPPSPSGNDAPAGKLTDRTGWGDASVARQLNKEFMPLASECIDQAKARRPRIEGLLAFTMVVAPTEHGRVVVASLELRPDNQIDDPELFECIRESSFALDGLNAPHDFDITMPLKPGGSG